MAAYDTCALLMAQSQDFKCEFCLIIFPNLKVDRYLKVFLLLFVVLLLFRVCFVVGFFWGGGVASLVLVLFLLIRHEKVFFIYFVLNKKVI